MALRLQNSTASKQRSTALRLFSSTAAFTLVEITLIVGILVVLSAIVLVTLNIRTNSGKANNVKRKIDLEQIQKALDLRAQETGDSLPSGLNSGLSERCVGTGSDTYNLSSVNWTTSAGADIKFDVRSCDDASCIGETWPGTPAFSSSPATLNISNASYFQYKASFNATETPWDQTTDTDFNTGINASTVVSGGSVKLFPVIGESTRADGTFDLSLGTGNGGCQYTGSDASGGAGQMRSGTSWVGSTCTINTTIKNTWNFTTVNIPNTYILTTSAATGGLTIKAGNVTIAGTINLDGKGCAGGNAGSSGQGGGASCNIGGVGAGLSASSSGGGGGHGGVGGAAAGAGGGIYDVNTSPVLLGSGGGGGSTVSNVAAAGGGAVKIVASGTVTISGTITAIGGVGANRSSGGGGGGSGGSVYIQAGTLAGSGNITANGNAGGQATSSGPGRNGGGGAGGMIAMYYGANNYTGTPTVSGGAAGSGTGTASAPGGAGTAPPPSAITVYPSIGTYTSAIKDTGQASDFTTVSWTSTIPSAATTMTIEMQSANLSSGADCSTGTVDWAGGSDWRSAATITTANANSSSNIPSTLDGKRCVQYRATLNTTNTAQTPSLDSITIKYFPGASKPVLNDVIITATSSLLGDARVFTHTTYNDFSFGSINPSGTLAITGSASPNDAALGTIEYSTGSPPMTYTSPVFSGSCYNLTTDLVPLYLGSIPKDPKTGTDANTGYLISVDPATKVVCVKAPGAELDETIENCRK